jgi:phytoene synthase
MPCRAERPDRLASSSDWARCQEIARRHGRTFYLASRFLPPARRRAALATYAFCRIADDIVDLAPQTGPDAAARELDRWEAQLEAPHDPVAIAFAETRARFAVPLEPAHDLLAGIRMDLTPARYATWADLRRYCYLVAGTVGLLVAPILGCRDPRALTHAAELGIAMQLTNILRDVGEDARNGRLYLPIEELEVFGCNPEAILAGRPGDWDRFAALMAFQIARARALYTEARRGIPALVPSGRLTTLAASRLYAGILTEIEALDYDVFRSRARVSSARKLRALPGIATAFLALSLLPVQPATGQRPPGRVEPAEAPATDLVRAGAAPWPEHQSYG